MDAWTVLDTCFGTGEGLLDAAVAVTESPQASGLWQVLHYVGFCLPSDLDAWPAGHESHAPKQPLAASSNAVRQALALELAQALSRALPGTQRVLLNGGRISLTLCAGALSDLLPQQLFQANAIRLQWPQGGLPSFQAQWDSWAIQALARRCQRGTTLTLYTPLGFDAALATADGGLWAGFIAQGFQILASRNGATPGSMSLQYDPPWTLRTTRDAARGKPHAVHELPAEHTVPASPTREMRPTPKPTTRSTDQPTPRRCVVVGGGLSGASVAHALALRGWQVSVIDSHAEPAQGASGLPVGLLVPHLSADDSPRSRLSRVGVRLTLQAANRLLQRGTDWNDNGVLEITADAQRQLAAHKNLQQSHWLADGHDHLAHLAGANAQSTQSLWHATAGWIKPARLVRAWLAHPAIHWHGGEPIQALHRSGDTWALTASHGNIVAEAELVVLANAMGLAPLLQTLKAPWHISPALQAQVQGLQELHGTLSFGAMPAQTTAFPPFALNGNGTLVSGVPGPGGPQWFTGATYELDATALAQLPEQHGANFKRLSALAPAAAQALAPAFEGAALAHWQGARCVSPDRMPIVGPVHTGGESGGTGESGLWVSAAMGARGLSFAALCAEILVAQLTNEPLPVEARLARILSTHRIGSGKTKFSA